MESYKTFAVGTVILFSPLKYDFLDFIIYLHTFYSNEKISSHLRENYLVLSKMSNLNYIAWP